MTQRARLNLSPEAGKTSKQPPRLGERRDEESAPAPESARVQRPRGPAFDARRVGTIAVMMAVGALSLYLLARRLSRV